MLKAQQTLLKKALESDENQNVILFALIWRATVAYDWLNNVATVKHGGGRITLFFISITSSNIF